MQRHRLFSITAGFALLFAARVAPAQTLDSATVAGFKWRSPGPANFMGRLSDAVGLPSPSKTIYVAAAGGGIWKSTNNGITWRPIFDDKSVVAMGMLAIAPSDTNQIWAGTGEPNSRNTIEPGAGLYKSNDGGNTWTFKGLEKTQHIGRIVVDPRNPNHVFVAALGAAWKGDTSRGLYETTDGGTTWRKNKAGANDRTGFVDIKIDPRNPDIMWASSWQRYRNPYSLNSGGPGSALWKTTDGGKTWTEIKGGGYPEGLKGRIGIGIAPSNPDVVYALTEAASLEPNVPYVPGQNRASGLYRTTDGGKTWERMNSYNTRPFYYSQVSVDPKKPDRVYYSSTPVHISNDGGKTEMEQPSQLLHVDTHALWIDPNDGERWFMANDGGIAITFDGGGNWYYPMNIPIAQFYEISYDNAVPYNVCAGAQDNGAWCGPSKRRGDINNSYWFTISGGDGFYTAQDPTDPNWVWGESQGGNVSGRNLKTGQTLRIAKPTWQEGYRRWEDSIATLRGDPLRPATAAVNTQIAALRAKQKQDSIDLSMRYNWNSPYFLSPHNPQVFYMAGNRVLKSLKRGEEMYPISPDLSKMVMPQYRAEYTARVDTADRVTGGITNDATGAETYGTIVALAESYVKPGLLYAGTDDGNLWITRNDGGTWEEVSDRLPGRPSKDIYVTRIEPSHFDTLTFYVALENHRWNDFTPYLYVTNDGGRSFRSIANNLPKGSPADYLHVVREDPYNRDLLFVGSSLSVYATLDRGMSWFKFASGLPSVPVFDLKIHPRDRELMAATHGRSIWIVPIASLEQMNTKTLAGTYLFKPTTAYQWGEGPTLGIPGNGHGQHPLTIPSPAYGAVIQYRVAPGTTGGAQIAVSDASGETIFQSGGPTGPGLQTVYWPFSVTRRVVAEPRVQSPSERRDSILLNVRAPMVLDSLQKAGFDTAAIGTVRRQVDVARGAVQPPAIPGGRGGGGGGGGGGRGGGTPGATANCHHPMTQWDNFCARPVEVPVQGGGRGAGGGGRGGRGGAGDIAPVNRIWGIIGMSPPAGGGGGRGGGGGGFGGGGGGLAPTGDYLVTLTVGGQTYKQTFRVEQTTNAGVSSPFSPEEQARAAKNK